MSGTKIIHQPRQTFGTEPGYRQRLVLTWGRLLSEYGTDLGSVAIRVRELILSGRLDLTNGAWVGFPTCLRVPYAMSGTERAYVATR
eukprot:1284260-Rhodomonas_salina.1